MASFDTVSLFTNIPVCETIQTNLNTIFTTSTALYGGFDWKKFKKSLEICTEYNVLIFNEKLYKQINGAPIGGCVSPALAEIFLSFHKQIRIDQCPTEFKPVVYRRYVDDTFILFKSIDTDHLFLDFLNKQHPSIKFTAELEKDNSISFLDIKVSKTELSFDTADFRKDNFVQNLPVII